MSCRSLAQVWWKLLRVWLLQLLSEGDVMNYWATIEYIRSGEAIVTLRDDRGEWSGSGLVKIRNGSRSDLYEQGYNVASLSAKSKGGRLARYSAIKTF
jgi:hypothetical protein